MLGGIRYVAPFVKEFVLMGVAGIITFTILQIVRRVTRKRRRMKVVPG